MQRSHPTAKGQLRRQFRQAAFAIQQPAALPQLAVHKLLAPAPCANTQLLPRSLRLAPNGECYPGMLTWVRPDRLSPDCSVRRVAAHSSQPPDLLECTADSASLPARPPPAVTAASVAAILGLVRTSSSSSWLMGRTCIALELWWCRRCSCTAVACQNFSKALQKVEWRVAWLQIWRWC